ncbi:hypothetical protein [Kribbella sp. VKM Ac-2568]|uniref:hypothetical protein n=1 Tax=Kribbella sp. VKM Ac-2568 TaxID=2512219 RepID=UPI00104DF484|nr:hypothetical protein [Kribbella sp. VKM Ac-2568]
MTKTFVAAPLLFIAYGIIRWIDGADGDHGPGLAWTIGHLLFLTGFTLYAVALFVLRGLLARARGVSLVALVAGLIGVAAFLRVIVIDLIVGFRADDHAAMSVIGDEYDRWPGDLGLYDTLYTVGPLLFLAGLLTLAILLTREHQLPVWSPVLLLLGFITITINLDLMPLGGVFLLVALLPLDLADRKIRTGSKAAV